MIFSLILQARVSLDYWIQNKDKDRKNRMGGIDMGWEQVGLDQSEMESADKTIDSTVDLSEFIHRTVR